MRVTKDSTPCGTHTNNLTSDCTWGSKQQNTFKGKMEEAKTIYESLKCGAIKLTVESLQTNRLFVTEHAESNTSVSTKMIMNQKFCSKCTLVGLIWQLHPIID